MYHLAGYDCLHNCKVIHEKLAKVNPAENDYVQRVFDIWVMEPRLPTPEEKIWIPSNPELGLQADRDRQWSAEDWENLNFPSYLVPTEIETHVNCEKVKEVLDSLSSRLTSRQATAFAGLPRPDIGM